MAEPSPTAVHSLKTLGISLDRPLVIVDVDEVLGLFMKGFGGFLESRGLEFRIDRFALFQNIYRPGAGEHLPVEEGRRHFEDFFRTHCGEIEPAPGAVEALNRLGKRAELLILSNAPADAERLRADWLQKHGLPHPLILNTGPKGPVTAHLVAQTPAPAAFVDDLLPNLDSVAEHAPRVATFQHVADERLRPLAPRSERHPRIDDWRQLADAIEAAVLGR
ncbi:hypothetical protein [Phenylobacterium sp.]|uniref:hypothetical protein n=1 Tax=Phenylobacterium sp. TaxID=1871053 RepID=UPI002F95AA68